MNDPYKILGIAKTASADEIKKSYRKLAKQHHPDLNPGSAEAAATFKDISSAYDLLSDPDKRARFDRGEIDASGQERADNSFYRSYAGGPQGARYRSNAGFDPSDIFADMFSRAGQGGGGGFGRGGGDFQEFRMRGGDLSYTLSVDFLEAAKGAQKRLSFPDGRTLDVNVPVGTVTGSVLRLRGQGQPGTGGGPAGDALIEITVEPHALFRREGNNVLVDLPVTLAEAVLGGKINVPTIEGPVSMTVPAGSNTGTRLRLRGRGIAPKGGAAGDQYITLKVMLPKEPDTALSDFIKNWPGREYDVRGT
ncbi:MAG TPA: DnaJ C-terminal domain-containing protein [Alphaproteobacteria bacterium]|jgi:DnaJ-class molecular chaperone|nr:DnaJ C-terminal domain-containing protein [Alphaproteobacteria bacterium]